MTINTATANGLSVEHWRNYLLLARKGLLHLDQLIGKCNELTNQNESENAFLLCKTYIENTPNNDKDLALFNYGAMQQAIGNHNEAEKSYTECIEISERVPQARINLGLLYEKKGNALEAIQLWQTVVAKGESNTIDKSHLVLALNHIGRVYENKKIYELAEQALEESLKINPKQPGVIQHWVHIRQKSCAWPVYKELPGISQNEMLMATSPLAMLALTDDPVQQLLTAYAFVGRTYGFKEEFLCKDRTYKHERLRIGYVSGDLCVHAVGLLLPELIEGHDRSKFELFGYDFSPEDGTPHRERLKNAFDHLRDIHHLSDRAVAELVLSDEIDVLIDLHGLSSGARPGIFALHPAPNQGTYLGFIGTTGMPWFDFVIADKHVLPKTAAKYFTEKPLYVDGCFLPLQKDETSIRNATRVEYGLPDDAFVMAAFGNVYKITPNLYNTWLTILSKIPSAILWLIDDNDTTTNNLKKYAKRSGADLTRIIFSPRTSLNEYKSKLKIADIFLDTYPYNCGSTSSDVINSNVPLVTKFGRSAVSRMGLSILTSTGKQQYACNTWEQYIELCVKLSLDLQMPNDSNKYNKNRKELSISNSLNQAFLNCI